MVNNKTKKKLKGKGNKISRIKTPEQKSSSKTKKRVTFKTNGNSITPEIWGDSPIEKEECYNEYKKNKISYRKILLKEAEDNGLTNKDEIESYVNKRLNEKKEARKKNKKIVSILKQRNLDSKERVDKERLNQIYIGMRRS
jgi:hypothetical protein